MHIHGSRIVGLYGDSRFSFRDTAKLFPERLCHLPCPPQRGRAVLLGPDSHAAAETAESKPLGPCLSLLVGSQSAVDSGHVSAGKADGSGWSEKSPESKLPGTTTGHGEDEIHRNGSRARAPLHPGPSDRTRALPSLLPAASRELRRAGARQCRDWLLVHR